MSETRIIRIAEVMNKTGLKRTTIYKRLKAGDFPAAAIPCDFMSGFIARSGICHSLQTYYNETAESMARLL